MLSDRQTQNNQRWYKKKWERDSLFVFFEGENSLRHISRKNTKKKESKRVQQSRKLNNKGRTH